MASGPRLMTRRVTAAWIAAAVAAVGAVVLASSEPQPPAPSPPAPTAVAELPLAPGSLPLPAPAERPKAPPSVLTAVPGGRELLWAERGTGTIRRAPIRGGEVIGPGLVIARLPVRRGPAGGVRGLAIGDDGRVYASYVRSGDGRLVVSQIATEAPRTVWIGPRAGRRRVGGGLVVLAGGRLAVGVGDQGLPLPPVDSLSIRGRVATLDPDGGPRQTPRRRSRGWHDPTAMARGRGAQIWVADRAGGADAERIGRADRPRAGAVRSGVRRAPIALGVSPGGHTLLVCGYLSGRVDRTDVRGEVAGSEPQVLPARCRYGLAVAGSRVFASGDDGRIRSLGTVSQLHRLKPLGSG